MKGVRIVLPLWAMLSVSATTAPAQVVPDYDFDWVTIGDVNNPPYEGETPFGGTHTLGRGSVPYEYRISRTEVTTGQWMEFVNTFSTQSDELRFFADPIFWGAEPDPTYTGPGRRWRLRSDVPNPKILPVGGISWRESAQFANWLHNGKGSDLSTLVTGAYDSTTWGDVGGRFTDDPTHLPGARFWIPTLDEWLKAVHYDPNKYGQGQGGWWAYPYASDDVPISGFPEDGGETSAGILCRTCPWDVALGAYPDQQTPWGCSMRPADPESGSRRSFFPTYHTTAGWPAPRPPPWNGSDQTTSRSSKAAVPDPLQPHSRGCVLCLSFLNRHVVFQMPSIAVLSLIRRRRTRSWKHRSKRYASDSGTGILPVPPERRPYHHRTRGLSARLTPPRIRPV